MGSVKRSSSALQECGADAEALRLGDTAPLYLAAGRGFAEVVDALVAAGANVDRTLRQRWPRSAVGPHFEEANGATALRRSSRCRKEEKDIEWKFNGNSMEIEWK